MKKTMKKKIISCFLFLITLTMFTPYSSPNIPYFPPQQSNFSSEPILASISEYDSRGHLTERYFYNHLIDSDSDGLFDWLELLVEVNVTAPTSYGYLVFVRINDPTFRAKFSDGSEEYSLEYWGRSEIEMPPLGLYNFSVRFKCSDLRAMKLAGPYTVTCVQLGEDGYGFFQEHNSYDNNKPLLRIPSLDISILEEPLETTDIIFQSASLSAGNVEFKFSYQTFTHGHPGMERYLINLVMENDTGVTICHYEEVRMLESNTLQNLTLKIPAEYLSAFNAYGGGSGGFAGSNFPVIHFRELSLIQYSGGYEPFYDSGVNVSYLINAHSESGIDISLAPPADLITLGSIVNYGLLNLHENKSFYVYGNTNEILNLQINSTQPEDVGSPSFEYFVIDGWGRPRDLWINDPSSIFISWNQWYEQTEIAQIYTRIGRYPGLWKIIVHYPDYGWSENPPLLLTVLADIFIDSSTPTLIIDKPSTGISIPQFYGVPFHGSWTDDSLVTRFLLIHGETILYSFSPYSSGSGWTGSFGTSNEFFFTWYPPQELTGTIELIVEATDLGQNKVQESISFTITPGTIPSPESTINKGLDWLEKHQNPDGSWDYYSGWHSAGMTALACLGFIQAGRTPSPIVSSAIQYLKGAFQNDPDSTVPGQVIWESGHASYETSMALTTLIAYNHTLATPDVNLMNLIDDAVEWLSATQNDETWGITSDKPWYGGWRYGYDHDSSDLSVTQWVVLALATYEAAGGYIAPSIWEKTQLFVERCRGGYWEDSTFIPDGGFSYTPQTEDWRDSGGSSYGSMTAAGIWGLFLSGVETDNPNITDALDWIASHSPSELVNNNPKFGGDFQYYWYLSASKAYLMAGRAEDTWWYDLITEFLNTHMIYDSPTSAYWDNYYGQEPPVMATAQAILAQQVFYGRSPTDTLEIILESPKGAAITVWNETWSSGYNYSTGQELVPSGSGYSGVLNDEQKVWIKNPTKGNYYLDLFPVITINGMETNQQLVLRARALTETSQIISFRTKLINYQYPTPYPQVLRYKLVYSTISGVNLEFLEVNPPLFSQTVRFDQVQTPNYVDLNTEFSVTLLLTNLGPGTIPNGAIYSRHQVNSGMNNIPFSSWSQGMQKSFTFSYNTNGLSAGKKIISLASVAEEVNPLLLRLVIQVGNQLPEGTMNPTSSVISGSYTFSWTASDPDGDSLIYTVHLLKPDGSDDILTTTSATTYTFDSTAYPDGSNYRLRVIIDDGTDQVSIETSLFEINNGTPTDGPQLTPGFNFVILIASLISLIAWMRRRR